MSEIVSMKRTLSYANGWAAEIVYKIDAADVPAHVAAHYLDSFPGTDSLTVSQIVDEPWMEGDVVQTSGLSQTRKLTYYFALAYLDVPWPDAIPRPDYTAGTTLRLSVRFSGQYVTLPNHALKSTTTYTPSSNPDGSPYTGGPIEKPVDAVATAALLVPILDYIVEWDRVTDLTALDFSGYVGQVNSISFMGCDAETLLCEGVSIDPSFVLDPAGPFCYKVRACFKKRAITFDGVSGGWNHQLYGPPYSLDPVEVRTASGTPPYASTDFTDFFLG